MEKKKSILSLGFLITLAASALFQIGSMFLPAITVDGTGYERWKVTFFYEPDFILDKKMFGPNIWMILAMVLPVILTIVVLCVWKNTKKGTRAVLSAISAVVNLYAGIVLMNTTALAEKNATARMMEYITPAIENGTYKITVITIILAILSIVVGIIAVLEFIADFKVASSAEYKAAVEAERKEKIEIKEKIKKGLLPKPIVSVKTAVKRTVPAMTVISAVFIAAAVVMNYFSSVMNTFFGYGKIIYDSQIEGSGDYYGETGVLEHISSTDDSVEYAAEVNKDVVGEAVTLLKNENNVLPLAAGSKVTVFGTAAAEFTHSAAGYKDNSRNFAEELEKGGYTVTDASLTGVDENNLSNNDAAFVCLYRSYGEGGDAVYDDYSLTDSTGRTKLSPTEEELKVIDFACQNFDNVIIVVNSANTMELGFVEANGDYTDPYSGTTYDFSHITGALWMGDPGLNGIGAVVDVINGNINPSGHTVDTFASSLMNAPANQNFGSYTYSNANNIGYLDEEHFVQYEEGIYVGYRYYETAYAEALAGNYAGFDYNTEVVYPFGYGLSYTTFDMEYDGTPSYDESTNEFTFNVRVTNTGDVAGKQVVEIFAHQPYTYGGIEKSEVLLAGYAKTSLLEAGESETVTITLNRDYLCSYDAEENQSYVLEAGDYNFYVSENAHSWASIDVADTTKYYTYTLDHTLIYNDANDGARTTDLVTAENQFDEMKDGMSDTVMSRSDFAGTFPASPTAEDCVASDAVLENLKTFDLASADDSAEQIPWTDSTDTTYTLADMRGLDYNDEKWQYFIEQFSAESLANMYRNGGWIENADADNGVPVSYDIDGPAGLTANTIPLDNTYGDNGSNAYQESIMIAASWNLDCARETGLAFANECYTNGITGWYGPGTNIHRSAFGGRNHEYYSEDSILSGTMAAAEVGAASEGGLICFNKHFALNNQETHRGGVCTWADEQAVREVYLRGWEYYVKNCRMNVYYYEEDENGNTTLASKEMSGATGIMCSYNRVGAIWSSKNTNLVVNVLQNEWGFTGTAETDALNSSFAYMDAQDALFSGACNLILGSTTLQDDQSDRAITMLQDAAHHILYNKANSNAVNGMKPNEVFHYTTAPWIIGLYVAGAIVVILDLLGVAYIVNAVRKNKKAKEAA